MSRITRPLLSLLLGSLSLFAPVARGQGLPSHAAASLDVRAVALWAHASGDHRGRPFAVVDKRDSRVHVFDSFGRPLGNSPALLGSALGDSAPPGIGRKKLSEIRPHERATQAGRFETQMGKGLRGENLLWVDYDSSLALHPMAQGAPAEQRAHRMASPSPSERRITYGCVNVPALFFESVVRPAFASSGVVYILPEESEPRAFFNIPADVSGS